jgi:hypothetical protein
MVHGILCCRSLVDYICHRIDRRIVASHRSKKMGLKGFEHLTMFPRQLYVNNQFMGTGAFNLYVPSLPTIIS